jgi:hypothetical protein
MHSATLISETDKMFINKHNNDHASIHYMNHDLRRPHLGASTYNLVVVRRTGRLHLPHMRLSKPSLLSSPVSCKADDATCKPQ